MSNSKSEESGGTEEKLRALVGRLPADYEHALVEAKALTHQFQAALATAIEGQLSAFIESAPHQTLGDKRAIAARVNFDLRNIHLCFRCPKTGHEAILVADSPHGEHSPTSRLRLESKNEAGHRVRTAFEKLDLIPSTALQEGKTRNQRPDDTGRSF